MRTLLVFLLAAGLCAAQTKPLVPAPKVQPVKHAKWKAFGRKAKTGAEVAGGVLIVAATVVGAGGANVKVY